MIARNIKLEVRLIDDLLDITKIAKNKLMLHEKPVDIHNEINHTLSLVDHDVLSKNLKIITNFDAKNMYINGDPARIQQIFWNIIKNSVKFSKKESPIFIRTFNDSTTSITIEISDKGIGIEPSLTSKIFEAFEQTDSSVTRKYGGLGIGLSITKGLVVLHHGTISAFSEGKNKGATFKIVLPIIPIPLPENTPSSLFLNSLNDNIKESQTILLVEDNKSTLLVMTRMIKRLGHNVITAMSIKEGNMKILRKFINII